MRRLNDSLRNWVDSYLHVQVREAESLLTMTQVDFWAELDALLSGTSRGDNRAGPPKKIVADQLYVIESSALQLTCQWSAGCVSFISG